MKKYSFLFFSILLLTAIHSAKAQTISVVKDDGLNGQLKRMVWIKWNDWSPKGWRGWIFWQVSHRKYRHGSDKRPYKVGGKFDQDYAQLMLQKQQEENIEKLTKEEAKRDEATYLSQSGGVLDIPYQTYFKGVFKKLLSEVDDFADKLAINNPEAYVKFYNDTYVKYYREEFLPMQTDRISIINTGLAPRGERIIAYMEVQKKLEQTNDQLFRIGKLYNKLTTLNKAKQVPVNTLITTDSITDKQIVTDILSSIKF